MVLCAYYLLIHSLIFTPFRCSLSPEVTKEVIKLVAVQRDILRKLRVNGDEPCHMMADIRDERREILLRGYERRG